MLLFFCVWGVGGGGEGGAVIWPKSIVQNTESPVSAKRFNFHQNLSLIFITI